MSSPSPVPTTWTTGTTEVFKTGTWRVEAPFHLHSCAPCHGACPAGEDAQAWIARIQEHKLQAAWEELVAANPLPAITGTGQSTMARTTCSSLKHHRSSTLPPPRTSRMRSGGAAMRAMRAKAAAMEAGAASPCTRQGERVRRSHAGRVTSTFLTSSMAAVDGEVMMPMCWGSGGSGRLRVASNQPRAANAWLRRSNSAARRPLPAASTACTGS